MKKFKRFLSTFLASILMLGMVSNATEITNNNISKEEVEIVNQYTEGKKMLPNQIKARKNKAEELNLLNWVDKNYFLVDDFYMGKSEADIEELGVNILVNTVTNEELNDWASNIKNGISLKTVTNYEKVSYGQSIVGKFEVDGHMAFCAQHSKSTPAKGSITGQATLNNNELVRKVLYYGYGGPGQLNDMTGNYGWVMTTLGLSKAYTGTGGPSATNFVNKVSSLQSPPSSFKVYIVQTNGGKTQDLAYWEYSSKGKLQIKKSSSNQEITNNNNCYLLDGAIYGVYKDESATNQVTTLITGANGKSQVIELDEGKYYIKEIKAPKGFALDNTIYPIDVTNGKLAIGEYLGNPQYNAIKILLKKVDSKTGNPVAQGIASLEGAEFTIKYYEGEYEEDVNPSNFGINPTRTWIMKTDKDGFILLDNLYKLSGDELYIVNGVPILPLGTITIEETKAPIGYKINPEIFVRKIDSDGTDEFVNTYNEPIVKEEVIKGKIEINKEDSEISGLKLEGIKFGIFDENNNLVEELTTDRNGYAISGWLNYGDYILKELKTKEGYRLSNKEWKVEIRADEKTYTYNIKNDVIKGQIQIVKTDSTNVKKPVQGATFNIVAEDVFGVEKGTIVDTISTDENGFAFTKELRYGKYFAQEIKVGKDYWLNTNKYRIDISQDSKIEVLHIKNDPVKMKLKVVKIDNESKEVISGTKFKVINKVTGEDVEFTEFFGVIPYKKVVFTTDKNGEIVFPQVLKAGSYSLVEVEPSEGYNAIESIDFNIDRYTNYEEMDSFKVITIKAETTKIKGNLKILEVDEEIKELLQGIKVKITCIDGFMKGKEWIKLTDENGEVNLTDLEYGKYEIEEVEGLWNYVENKEPIKFEITENGKTIELKVTNKKIKGSVELLKVDKNTNRPLKGAAFKLYKGDFVIGEYDTDENGRIIVENLEAGNYYFREVSTLNEYIINNDISYDFAIVTDEEVIKIIAKSEVKEGEFDFSKTDVSTGDLVEGATINIKGLDEQNNHINLEFVSTKEETRFKLPVGKYQFSEKVAPEGFVLNEEVGYLEILENEVIKAELKNKRIEGILEFEKSDISTGEVVEGAHIKIECVEGFNKGQVIEFVSSSEGNKFKLDYGKYIISETMAPEGYELTTETSIFEINKDGQIVKAQLKNKKVVVTELPQTGGTNTVIVISLALVIALTGVIMFRKKKGN